MPVNELHSINPVTPEKMGLLDDLHAIEESIKPSVPVAVALQGLAQDIGLEVPLMALCGVFPLKVGSAEISADNVAQLLSKSQRALGGFAHSAQSLKNTIQTAKAVVIESTSPSTLCDSVQLLSAEVASVREQMEEPVLRAKEVIGHVAALLDYKTGEIFSGSQHNPFKSQFDKITGGGRA